MRSLILLLLSITLTGCAGAVSSPSAATPVAVAPVPSASPAVDCIPDQGAVTSAFPGDACPEAIAATLTTVASLGSVARVYLVSGIFICGHYWPGAESPNNCEQPYVLPGSAMHGWVSFTGTTKVAAVGLQRTPASLSAPAGPWQATVASFQEPPSGWVMP